MSQDSKLIPALEHNHVTHTHSSDPAANVSDLEHPHSAFWKSKVTTVLPEKAVERYIHEVLDPATDLATDGDAKASRRNSIGADSIDGHESVFSGISCATAGHTHFPLPVPLMVTNGTCPMSEPRPKLKKQLSVEDLGKYMKVSYRELRRLLKNNKPVSSDHIPEVEGRVHSVESMSAVDGPGLRYLIFLQGCPRRCNFCSQPDSWEVCGGNLTSSKALKEKIQRCVPFLKPNRGGITISGGEPLMQPEFVAAMFEEAHVMGLTTTLDTTGFGTPSTWDVVLPHADLVMLCLKSFNKQRYEDMTTSSWEAAYAFAEELQRRGIPFWLRVLLIPGWTDNEEEYRGVEEFAAKHSCMQAMELLPYHRLGVEKWHEMGLPYPLEGLQPPPKELTHSLIERFRAKGITVLCNS